MKSKGFTLIEILIVISIIALLISIALPSFRGMQNEARKTKAQGDLNTIRIALEAYCMDHRNQYPAETNYQATLIASYPNILSNIIYDPFGATSTTQYMYSTDTHNPTTAKYYIIYSVGPSGSANASVSSAGVVTSNSDTIWASNGH